MKLSGVRLLLVLPQLPQDPASGAARSTRTMCEMLAAAGATVQAVGTTASEAAGKQDPASFLRQLGIDATVHRSRGSGRGRPELEFFDRGIDYRLLDVGPRNMHAWQRVLGTQFDILFDRILHQFRPDVVLGFGGLPGDRRRYDRARRQGARIVLSLRNYGYIDAKELLAAMDGILTPSRFLTEFYRTVSGVDSTPLPLPIDLEDVVSMERDPIFFTMINPAPEKGLVVMARLAEELGIGHPDIPLLIVESRGSAGNLVRTGLAGGFDLRRHENLMMSPTLAQPREIYLATRALLAPSLWQEPAGRVAAEALLNGIPPLVSDRGGLPETCNGAGFYLPIAPDVEPGRSTPVGPEVVEPWLGLIERLATDEEFYRAESLRAKQAASIYLPENLAPRYVEYFRELLD